MPDGAWIALVVAPLVLIGLAALLRSDQVPKRERLGVEADVLPWLAAYLGLEALLPIGYDELPPLFDQVLSGPGNGLLWTLRILSAVALAVGARPNSSDVAMTAGSALGGLVFFVGLLVAIAIVRLPGGLAMGQGSALGMMLFLLGANFFVLLRYRHLVRREFA